MPTTALPSGDPKGMSLTEEATARTLILATVYRYASLAREGNDYSETVGLFEPDGKVYFPGGREVPISQLGQIVGGNTPKLLRHHLTTIDIQFASPEEVHCQSYIIAGTDMKMPDQWGRWDVLRKQTDGCGCFRRRSLWWKA